MNFGKYIKFSDDPLCDDLSDLMQEGIENYLCHGLSPGGFLTAVLANDLMSAASRADHWNKTRIVPIAKWILHNAPAASFGSYEKVNSWCKDVDYQRSSWFDPIEKKFMWEILTKA